MKRASFLPDSLRAS